MSTPDETTPAYVEDMAELVQWIEEHLRLALDETRADIMSEAHDAAVIGALVSLLAERIAARTCPRHTHGALEEITEMLAQTAKEWRAIRAGAGLRSTCALCEEGEPS